MPRPYLLLLLLLSVAASGQTPTSPVAVVADPLRAQFYTQDITNFWRAFDAWQTGQPGNPFTQLYWQPASVGARILFEKNSLPHPDSLLRRVQRRRTDYERIRAASLRMADAVPQCRAAYMALKNLYPAATFPPVYLAIGGFGVGGNAGPAGPLIGAEMNDPAAMPTLIAHEIIHAQQRIPYKYHVLLEQCLIEGSADFLGELIVGRLVNAAP